MIPPPRLAATGEAFVKYLFFRDEPSERPPIRSGGYAILTALARATVTTVEPSLWDQQWIKPFLSPA